MSIAQVVRCPNCHPHYRLIRNGHRRLGWAVREDYVGYLVVQGKGIKPPPKSCPECGAKLLSSSP